MRTFRAGLGGQSVGKSSTEDVRRLLKDFEEKKVDAVVLDLRHNGGGSLREALALTGLFIDHGPVVQEVSRRLGELSATWRSPATAPSR